MNEHENILKVTREWVEKAENDFANAVNTFYGVSTKALNQAVKRNTDRFPSDFAFQLDPGEVENVRAQSVSACKDEANRSQFVTGSQKHRDPRFRPYAFTEHDPLMAASALNSEQAIQLNIQIQEDL